jgi:hypothetical protein
VVERPWRIAAEARHSHVADSMCFVESGRSHRRHASFRVVRAIGIPPEDWTRSAAAMNLREKSNLHPQHPVNHLSVCRHFGLEERGRFARGIELERRQRDAPVRGPRQSSESRQVRRYHRRSRGEVGVSIRGGSGSHFCRGCRWACCRSRRSKS